MLKANKLGQVRLPKGVKIWELVDGVVREVQVIERYDGQRMATIDPRRASCIAINEKNARRKLMRA